MRIPINNLGPENSDLLEELTHRLQSVLRSGDFMLGEEVEKFESSFARWCGAEYAIGVNSGTDALALALEAVGIGPGDEVVTVPNTFVATVGAILEMGAAPVLVDVGADDDLNPGLAGPSHHAPDASCDPRRPPRPSGADGPDHGHCEREWPDRDRRLAPKPTEHALPVNPLARSGKSDVSACTHKKCLSPATQVP